MTAFVLNLWPQQVIVAMDTLAMASESKTPLFFTTKFYLLPHIGGAMFATGLGDLATKWFVRLDRFVARDIHHLNDYVTPLLVEISEEFGLNADVTTTIYHVGFSENEQRYVGFAYRSTNGFVSERLEYGLRTKPGLEGACVDNYPDDFVRIMKLQRAADEALPRNERVFIGGEIQALILEQRSMSIQTLHRFEDFDFQYAEMCEGLQ